MCVCVCVCVCVLGFEWLGKGFAFPSVGNQCFSCQITTCLHFGGEGLGGAVCVSLSI